MNLKYPGNGGMKAVGYLLDGVSWVALALPRIVLYPIGRSRLRKRQAQEDTTQTNGERLWHTKPILRSRTRLPASTLEL